MFQPKKKKLALVIISKNFDFFFFNLLNLLPQKKNVEYMQIWLLEAILAYSQHIYIFLFIKFPYTNILNFDDMG